MVDGWMHNSNKPCFFQFSLQFKMTFLVPPLISTQIAFNSLPLTSPLIFLLQSSKIKPPSALCSYCNTPERVCLFVFFLFLFCFALFFFYVLHRTVRTISTFESFFFKYLISFTFELRFWYFQFFILVLFSLYFD